MECPCPWGPAEGRSVSSLVILCVLYLSSSDQVSQDSYQDLHCLPHQHDQHGVQAQVDSSSRRPKLSQHKSTPSLRTVKEENTEPATEQAQETVEKDGMEKKVFSKADESVFLKDDCLFCTNRRDSLSSSQLYPKGCRHQLPWQPSWVQC